MKDLLYSLSEWTIELEELPGQFATHLFVQPTYQPGDTVTELVPFCTCGREMIGPHMGEVCPSRRCWNRWFHRTAYIATVKRIVSAAV